MRACVGVRRRASAGSAGDGRWTLINASPDLGQQIRSNPALHPQNGLRELTGGELDDARREANFYHALDLRKNYTKLTVAGIERVNEHDTYVLEATRAEGAPDKMYFDTQTGLIVRSVNQRYTPDGVTEFQADVDDYTEVDGVKLPFTVRQTGASATFVIRFTEVHHNLQLTDAQFAKPPVEPPAETPAAPAEKQPE